MKCSGCGKEISEDLIFCPACGRKTQTAPKQEGDGGYGERTMEKPVPEPRNITEDFQAEDRTVVVDRDSVKPVYSEYPPKAASRTPGGNVWLVVTAAILGAIIVVLIAVILFAGDFKDGREKEENILYECGVCGDRMESDDEFCDNCRKKHTCEMCGNVKEKTSDGWCEDCSVEYTCRVCRETSSDVTEGYCGECRNQMRCKNRGCDTVVEKGYYCDDCADALVSADSNGRCFVCDRKTDTEDIFVIDTYGMPYCEDCDTGKYCVKCNGYVEEENTGDTCSSCSETFCIKCGKTLSEDKVAHTDENGNNFCGDCSGEYKCRNCGVSVEEGETLCSECSEE